MAYIVHGILQARILERVAFPFSEGSSQPRKWTQVSHIAGRFSASWATREAQQSRNHCSYGERQHWNQIDLPKFKSWLCPSRHLVYLFDQCTFLSIFWFICRHDSTYFTELLAINKKQHQVWHLYSFTYSLSTYWELLQIRQRVCRRKWSRHDPCLHGTFCVSRGKRWHTNTHMYVEEMLWR